MSAAGSRFRRAGGNIWHVTSMLLGSPGKELFKLIPPLFRLSVHEGIIMTRIFSPSQGLSGALFRYPANVVAMACAHAITSAAAFGKSADVRDFADLSNEQFSNIDVTSESKLELPLGTSASSVFVSSADVIRRSCATSLPEALRLAPNLQFARTVANL